VHSALVSAIQVIGLEKDPSREGKEERKRGERCCLHAEVQRHEEVDEGDLSESLGVALSISDLDQALSQCEIYWFLCIRRTHYRRTQEEVVSST